MTLTTCKMKSPKEFFATNINEPPPKLKAEFETACLVYAEYYHAEMTKAKKPTTRKVSPFIEKHTTIFLIWYQTTFGLAYVWSAKDDKAIGGILSKIKKLNQGNKTPEEIVTATFNRLLDRLPQWYIANGAELSVINGKFNSIITQIRKENEQAKSSVDNIFDHIARTGQA